MSEPHPLSQRSCKMNRRSVSANVVDTNTGKPILPPFVIKQVKGIRMAFIGAVLKETPTIVTPSGVAGLKFLDEADSINRYVRRLRMTEGIRTFVVLIHQGGRQTTYEGPTQLGGLINLDALIAHIQSLPQPFSAATEGRIVRLN